MMRPILASLSFAAALGFALPAAAHSLLVNPPPLIQNDSTKAGPCGCYFGAPEDPAEDPDAVACPADFPVTTLEAGAELTVTWKETINHDGDFRIAYSPKAPDQTSKADADANILMQLPDENDTGGATLEQKITVPSEPCELCVLQLRQYMLNAGYYYSCAAVKIVAPSSSTSSGTGGGGAGGTSGGTGGEDEGAGAGKPDVVSSGAGYADPAPEVAEGCSASPAGTRNAGALAILGIAVAAGTMRLRSRRRNGGGRISSRAPRG